MNKYSEVKESSIPLAERLRPKTLGDFIGQEHIVDKSGIIGKLLEKKDRTEYFPSLILWGPPGCGKTSLAKIIASTLNKPCFEFSAVNASIKEIEKEINNHYEIKQRSLLDDTDKKQNNRISRPPVIIIDEIHRFNKAQQDTLLPHVEQGKFILIGATTENPSFEVIGPLLSRTRVVILKQLNPENLGKIIVRGLKELDKEMNSDGIEFLKDASNGDARVALNILEIASHLAENRIIGIEEIKNALQKSQLSFDLRGEEYYNTISALHKSIRGSDPNAALYYLARLLESGQDPLYIARRLIRCASEDIGLNDPQALVISVSAFQACEKMGMPECSLALAETVVYLSRSPKSNSLYISYGKAVEDVQKYGNLPIPLHIRNAPTQLMKDIGYGKGYDYYHNPTGEKKHDVEYFPDRLKGRKYL